MVNSKTSKTIIVEKDPANQSTDSTHMQNDDLRAMNQPPIYYIQNCGMVYIDSFNTRTSHMQNSGNHRPQISYHDTMVIGQASNIELLHPQSHEEFNGPTPSTASNFHPEIPTNPLLQTRTTAVKNEFSKEIADVPLQMNNYHAHLDPTKTAQPFQRPDLSGDPPHHTLEPPTHAAFSGVLNDHPYSSNPNQSPPSPNSSLTVPSTLGSHISIPMHCVVLFSSVGLIFCSCLVLFFGLVL